MSMAKTATKYKVIYDVDDVLWDLNGYVLRQLGIPPERHVMYDVSQGPLLSATERQDILASFKDPAIFENIDFYPGADEILAVEALGGEVYIHSNNFNSAIAEHKRRQLRQLLPAMNPQRINLSIINHSTNTKQLLEDVLIFIDDSPYNVAKSQALVNIMPNKCYNTYPSEAAKVVASGKVFVEGDYQEELPSLLQADTRCVIRADNLLEINQMIRNIILMKKEMMYAAK